MKNNKAHWEALESMYEQKEENNNPQLLRWQ